MADYQIRRKSTSAAREIKASAHYSYITNGITLDGSKFAAGELVVEGQCLARNATTGKFEKVPADDAGGVLKAGYDTPVILDESVQFVLKDDGTNPDVTVGQVLVHGVVYAGMLKNATDGFKKALAGTIRFV